MAFFDQNMFNQMLAKKYQLLGQNANDESRRTDAFGLQAAAGANLDNVRAGLLPQQAQADIAATQANTAGQLETNRYIGPQARAQIALQGTQGKQNLAQASLFGSEADKSRAGSTVNPLLLRLIQQYHLGQGDLPTGYGY